MQTKKPFTKNVSPLAEATWQAFSPFLSRYQWAFDHPSHSPRKNEIIYAIRNRGKPGACTFVRPEGYKYILPVLHPRHFEKAISTRSTIYYVSWGRHSLLYFDIDLHQAWQTLADGQEARRLIDALLSHFFGQPVLFWSASSRGLNGYLKVDLQGTDYPEANALFGRVQQALQLYLADHENLADFEIKGRVGFLGEDEYDWSQYGKLPIHAADWNLARLEEFNNTPTVALHKLGILCERVEAEFPADILTRHKARKKALGDAPVVENGYFLVTPALLKALLQKHGEAWRYMFAAKSEDCDGNVWLGLQYYRPGETPITEWELRRLAPPVVQGEPVCPVQVQEGATDHLDLPDYMKPKPGVVQALEPVPATVGAEPDRSARPQRSFPARVNLNLDDLRAEPDSFSRQRQALLRLARYLKRVPTEDEALEFIKGQRLFTGTWEENLPRRRERVRSCLKFIALTFDPARCSASGAVNVGKYDAWATQKFPHGFTGTVGRGMNQDCQVYEGKVVHVGPEFIAVFLAVVEHCLLTQPNEDGSLPHDRAAALWDALYTSGVIALKFCARKWAVCRDGLDGYGILDVYERNYHSGQAMKWRPGLYFPLLGLWKTKKCPSLRGPGTLPEGKGRREEEHNTWLRQQRPWQAVFVGRALPRPPPRAAPFSLS